MWSFAAARTRSLWSTAGIYCRGQQRITDKMIRFLVADGEKDTRKAASDVIAECIPGAAVVLCGDAEETLWKLKEQPFDIALIDPELPGIGGIRLAERILEADPRTNIIFCAGTPDHAEDAFRIHASGYIRKPLSREKLFDELAVLRFPIFDGRGDLWVQTFGNFEVFYNKMPLRFKYQKTKELFAYLIDRNCAVVDTGEIRAILWDDNEDHTSYMKQLRKDLIDTFRAIGKEDVIVSVRGGIGIRPGRISCDYFEYLAGDPKGLNAYHGEYMQQYSWSELTHGVLEMGEE